MAINSKSQIPENTKIAELSVKEFRTLMHDIVANVVQEALFELEQQLPDPDAGKALKPAFAEQLRQSVIEEDELVSIESVAQELGLDG